MSSMAWSILLLVLFWHQWRYSEAEPFSPYAFSNIALLMAGETSDATKPLA